jgi:uncharacterized repeat protein (TIGR02543 family)
MSGFGTGSNSNGQFWFGGNTFPGFLFKKNMGVGGRRSTKFNPGGNIICNSPTYLYNKYKPGAGGVGASSMSNRRAKNRLATVCGTNQCFPCYNTLGQYSNYTHNPNGFIPCPAIAGTNTNSSSVTPTPTPTPSGSGYIVTYNGNGSTGGTAPSDGSYYASGSPVTVLGTGSLTRANYTFAGWNTVATTTGGFGTLYSPTNTFAINADTTLYAQWIQNPRVFYNSNSIILPSLSTITGTLPTSGTYYSPNSTVTVSANTGSLAATGTSTITFAGWNTQTFGTGTYYPATGTNTFTIYNDNVTLYAQWYSSSGTNYSVTYDANGGSGSVPAAPTNYKQYQSVSILGNTGSLTNGLLTFNGWNTKADGTGDSYPVSSNGFTMPPQNVILYAQWINPATPPSPYTLTYDGNGSTGGSVPASATSYSSGTSVGILNNNGSLVKTGYAFVGWNTEANGTGTSYLVNNVYSNYTPIFMSSNKTLYAQWVAGTLFRSCGTTEGLSTNGNFYNTSSVASYRDVTNNTFTIIQQAYYSTQYGGPYGTGNGPFISGLGNLISTYAQATISQVLGVYQITANYITKWTGTGSGIITQIQTATQILGSTYWPTGETIASVTMSSVGAQPIGFAFDVTPSVTVNTGGCFNQVGANGSLSPGNYYLQYTGVQSFYFIFNNGFTTRVAFGSNIYLFYNTSLATYTLQNNLARIQLAVGATPTPLPPSTPSYTGAFTVISSAFADTV